MANFALSKPVSFLLAKVQSRKGISIEQEHKGTSARTDQVAEHSGRGKRNVFQPIPTCLIPGMIITPSCIMNAFQAQIIGNAP